MTWAEKYLGIPYTQMNCAQLVAHVLREEFGRDDIATAICGFRENQISNAFARTMALANHTQDHAEQITEPENGAVCFMRHRARFAHIGIACVDGDSVRILHAVSGLNSSSLQRLQDLPRLALTVESWWRLKARASA